MNIHVDPLSYAKDPEQAGIQRAHAEAIATLQARSVSDPIEHELVTKDFLKGELAAQESRLKDEIRKESSTLRVELRKESNVLRDEIRSVLVQLRALQYGGAIAAFALSLLVLFVRLSGS